MLKRIVMLYFCDLDFTKPIDQIHGNLYIYLIHENPYKASIHVNRYTSHMDPSWEKEIHRKIVSCSDLAAASMGNVST